jgi:hypothetical protein
MRILALIALLIAYGSLYPGDFSSADENALKAFLGDWRLFTSTGDVLGNIALFFPLGMAGILIPPNRKDGATHFAGLFIFALIYAFTLQLAQVWLPSCSAALADVIWNMVGMSLGASAAYLIGTVPRRQRTRHAAVLVSRSIIALWLLAELLPLVPTLDLQKMKDALKPLLFQFDFSFSQTILHAAGILAAGSALGTTVRRPLLWMGALLALILAGKVVIINHVVDASLLAGISIGYFAYVGMAIARQGNAKLFRTSFWLLLAAWTVTALTPFSLAPGGAFSGIPFATMLRGSMETAAQEIARSLFIYTALIWLAEKTGTSIGKATLGLAIWACIIELTQMALLGRTADVTEPMLLLTIGWILSSLLRESIPVPQHELGGLESGPPVSSHHPAVPHAEFSGGYANIRENRKHMFMLIAAGMAIFTMAGWIILRSSLTPYNVRELLYQGHPFRSLILLVLLLYWAFGLPVMFTQWLARGQLYVLSLPPLVLAHGMVAWMLLRSAVPSEAIHDIVGSPILGWPWEWELLGRFLALFGFWSTAMTGGVLIASRSFVPHFSYALTGWSAGTCLLVPLAYYVVVVEASTDNLVELIANNGGVGAFLLIGLAVAIASSAGTRMALAQASGPQDGRGAAAAVWVLGSAVLIYIMLYFGTEQVIVKYDQVFSAMQFLLSSDRSHLASPGELVLRYAAVYCALVAAIAMVQYPLWWLISRGRSQAGVHAAPRFPHSAG